MKGDPGALLSRASMQGLASPLPLFLCVVWGSPTFSSVFIALFELCSTIKKEKRRRVKR